MIDGILFIQLLAKPRSADYSFQKDFEPGLKMIVNRKIGSVPRYARLGLANLKHFKPKMIVNRKIEICGSEKVVKRGKTDGVTYVGTEIAKRNLS
ncbi:hypothetical protein QUF80_20790 [Desulfococcaceae bacterium HSG8]|nr:hypothetical protein [Desulfococcaceae bacterium HSG8]